MGTFGRLVFCAVRTQIVGKTQFFDSLGKREKQKGTNGMSHRKALLRRIYGAYYRIRRNLGAFIRWCIFSIIIGASFFSTADSMPFQSPELIMIPEASV